MIKGIVMTQKRTTSINTVKNKITIIIGLGNFNYTSLIEMNSFTEQQELSTSFDPNLPIQWAVYPNFGSNGGSYIHVDAIQGLGKRCPLILIRLDEENPNILFTIAKNIFNYLAALDPFQLLMDNSHP